MSLPGFRQLDTFPDYIIRGGQVSNVALGERTNCAMCGELCVYGMPKNGENTILKGNKGVCTACTTTGFILPGGDDAFKWCATHHTFRPMDDFGDRPMASSCSACREKRRERERRAAARAREVENSSPNGKPLLRLSGKTKSEDVVPLRDVSMRSGTRFVGATYCLIEPLKMAQEIELLYSII